MIHDFLIRIFTTQQAVGIRPKNSNQRECLYRRNTYKARLTIELENFFGD